MFVSISYQEFNGYCVWQVVGILVLVQEKKKQPLGDPDLLNKNYIRHLTNLTLSLMIFALG